MRVLGLDPATVTGWCDGDPTKGIVSGSIRVREKGQPIEVGPFNMLCFLRDQWAKIGPPDYCAVEAYMPPAAQKNSDAIPLQIMLYGVIVGMCQAYGVPFAAPTRMDVLSHFTGRRSYGDRAKGKRAVLERCWMTGLLPKTCFDEDRADAIATYDWGVGHWRLQSKMKPNLVMFAPPT